MGSRPPRGWATRDPTTTSSNTSFTTTTSSSYTISTLSSPPPLFFLCLSVLTATLLPPHSSASLSPLLPPPLPLFPRPPFHVPAGQCTPIESRPSPAIVAPETRCNRPRDSAAVHSIRLREASSPGWPRLHRVASRPTGAPPRAAAPPNPCSRSLFSPAFQYLRRFIRAGTPPGVKSGWGSWFSVFQGSGSHGGSRIAQAIRALPCPATVTFPIMAMIMIIFLGYCSGH